ncbi:hypothetical protein HAX54_036494, partial [Datura stramonium]|nr:hypothetical protein [Datura stramonium]
MAPKREKPHPVSFLFRLLGRHMGGILGRKKEVCQKGDHQIAHTLACSFDVK